MGVLDRFRLDGRTALVTGAGRGIGRGLAHALAEAGADVAVADIDAHAAARVSEEIRGLGRRSIAISADVSKSADVRNMVAALMAEWGHLDIGVNNAGVAGCADCQDMTEEEWDRVINVNLKGVFLCAQAEARVMIPAGYGKIINIGSMSARIVNRPQRQIAYNSSKAGVVHLTRSMAVELARQGICVNSISPGYTRTDLISGPEFAELIPQWLRDIPVGRMAEISDLQGAVVFLAAAASDYITGHDLVIDGGFTCW